MTKYICIELNVQKSPAERQYRFFLKFIRFTDKIQCERIDHLIYISYDDADPMAMRVVQRLPRYFLRGFRITECSEHIFKKIKRRRSAFRLRKILTVRFFLIFRCFYRLFWEKGSMNPGITAILSM